MLTVDFDLLGVKENEIVLDAGCGEGRHSFECIRRNTSVFSMDMDMESLRKTRYSLVAMKRENYKSARFQIHAGNALKLPFRDKTFDRIICAEVLEHVSDDNEACKELARVLKSGGSIAITIPTYCSEVLFDLITEMAYKASFLPLPTSLLQTGHTVFTTVVYPKRELVSVR